MDLVFDFLAIAAGPRDGKGVFPPPPTAAGLAGDHSAARVNNQGLWITFEPHMNRMSSNATALGISDV